MLIYKTVHVVESSLSCLCVIVSARVDFESDGAIAAGETATLSETDFSPCNPQANSTVLDTFPRRFRLRDKGERSNEFTFER